MNFGTGKCKDSTQLTSSSIPFDFWDFVSSAKMLEDIFPASFGNRPMHIKSVSVRQIALTRTEIETTNKFKAAVKEMIKLEWLPIIFRKKGIIKYKWNN